MPLCLWLGDNVAILSMVKTSTPIILIGYGPVASFIHTWAIVEEIFNPLSVSMGASVESRCCHLILDSSV
jgi:hypothetical protein